MTDSTGDLVLETLNGLRNDMAALRIDMRDQSTDLKQRMLAIERVIVGLKRDIAEVYYDHTYRQALIDKLTARVERIERHLELDA